MSTVLPDAVIDVWSVLLDESESIDARLVSLLDEPLRLKLANFKQPGLRAKYVRMQGIRRQILARYLDEDPAMLKFGEGRYGKPHLINEPELGFNVSHSGNWFVVAVAWRCDLGVDVEVIKPRKGLHDLVNRCFAVEEQVYWLSLPEEQQIAAFYRIWTAKEALVKAVGRGIALGLEHCVIDAQHSFQWLRLPDQCGLASQWQVGEVELGEHRVHCSLVHNKQQATINIRTWL